MTNFVIRRFGGNTILDIVGMEHIRVSQNGTRAEIRLSEKDVVMLREGLE